MSGYPKKSFRCLVFGLGSFLYFCLPLGPRTFFGAEAWAQQRGQESASKALKVEGTVLALDGEQLVVDVGQTKGGALGLTVELWRPVKLKHPVTGALISDRFRLGDLSLIQVRPTLALAEVVGTPTRPPAVGDVVILNTSPSIPSLPERPEPETSQATSKPEAKASPAVEAEAQGLAAIFDDLNQSPIPERIQKLEKFAQSRPAGRFSEVLLEEAKMLRTLLQSSGLKESEPPPLVKPKKIPPFMRRFAAPLEATEDTPLHMAVELSDNATGAILHIRPVGRTWYDSLSMKSMGQGYFSATISPEHLASDQVEYFIEATDEDGEVTPVGARADKPSGFVVYRKPGQQSRQKHRMSLVLLSEYADFNRLRGNDRMWQSEGYFGIRFQTLGVRALRTGFGVLRGVGGSVEELDREINALPGREVGLTYGYLELEVGLWESFSLLGRGVVGLLDDGVSGGAQMFMRFGSDLGTNLTIGGEVLGGVGLRTVAQLELAVFEKVPVLLRAETTTQPAGGAPSRSDTDVAQLESERGTRLIVQAGYRVLPNLTLSARASIQSRTITHSGPGFGGALGYTW